MNNNMGYIIIETATVEEATAPKFVSDNGRRVTAEVILQDMNVLNRNKRFYSTKQMSPALKAERLTELVKMGRLYGEEGHPRSKEISRQQIIEPSLRSFRIVKFWVDGNDIKAHVRGSNLPYGEAFNQDLLDGEKPSFSLRALGTVNNTSKGAEVENITIITWDNVIYPSHKRAYTQNIIGVAESTGSGIITNQNKFVVQENDNGLLIPIINQQQIIDYVKEESTNMKMFKESFDLFYNSAILLENKRQIQITAKNGDVVIVNLENHIQNDIMNYCTEQVFR